MRHLLLLAAAVTFAVGCHSRTEDEVGAAPDQGDTTTVTATDTTMVAPMDTTMGQLPEETDTVTVEGEANMETYPDTVSAEGEVETGDTTGAWTDTTSTETADTAAVPAE